MTSRLSIHRTPNRHVDTVDEELRYHIAFLLLATAVKLGLPERTAPVMAWLERNLKPSDKVGGCILFGGERVKKGFGTSEHYHQMFPMWSDKVSGCVHSIL